MKAIHIEIWYDRHTKSWVIQSLDREGNQIGDATFVATKKEAEYEKQYREKEVA